MSKVLVVVDYQKDFVDGALGFKKAEALEEGIYNKVKEYLDNGDKVVFTYDTHYDNYLETREGINLPVKHCIKGTEGHKLYGSKLNSINFNENTVHICKEVFGISPEDMIDLKNKLGHTAYVIEGIKEGFKKIYGKTADKYGIDTLASSTIL